MIKPRTLARRLAMQYAFMCDLNAEWTTTALEEFLTEHCDIIGALNFARELAMNVVEQHTAIDAQITPHLRHWELARLAATERNVLRVAVAELNTTTTDKKVIITEAINLAQNFGGKNSGKFVNGVLDALAKNHHSA